jgi:glucose/mannose transport system substrate-binding protein
VERIMKKALIVLLSVAAVTCGKAGGSSQSPEGRSAAQPQSVEVLHWWTSGGEAAALKVLKDNLEKQGVTWNDMPVAGGGGEAAMTSVRARVVAGNPPAAVQLLGFDIQDWATQGVLADLTPLATQSGWDTVVPQAVQRFSKYQGKWIAVPVDIHSTNWIWASKAVLETAGVTTEPKDFDEFIADAQKVQKAGFVAIAHGGQPWQEAAIFDSVALATGGVGYYRKAFIDLDPQALSSPTTVKVFQRMSQIKSLVDKDFSGRDWNVASGMVISGKAGFQIMGDWAKGEFVNARQVPGQDFLCYRFPGTQGAVAFNTDQFAMFKLGDGQKTAAQMKLAADVMDPAFQSSFNVVKGAAPARLDVPDAAFDACGKKAIRDVAEASRNDTLVGSIALGHAVPASLKNAFYDVITRHFNGQIDDRKAVAELVSAAKP